MASPRLELMPYGSVVSAASHCTGWAAHICTCQQGCESYELISVAVEMGLVFPSKAKIIDLKKSIESSAVYKNDIEFVRSLVENALEKNAEILTYQLQTVTYGLSKAPLLALRTLQQLAKDEKSRFPLASETLLYDTYMDDIVSGAPDLETAQQLQSQLKDALQSCGMNLHKWSSNSLELLNSSLSSDVEHSFSTDIDLSVKTLGEIIESHLKIVSCLRYMFQLNIYVQKSEVLSVIAKLCDPLGFLGPVIAKAKNRSPRICGCICSGLRSGRLLRVFSSQRCCQSDHPCQQISCCTNSSYSIPRLELCACVLLAQFVKKIRSTLRLNISGIGLHTDSTIALTWLNTPADRLKTFVANRVAKLQELTEGFQWNHVPSVPIQQILCLGNCVLVTIQI
ncbi:integrase catalytic domain-containing protein [Trichonephila clavipes]|nr:integrase catalytic domain-containing protein [Trichonephila clavipes]